MAIRKGRLERAFRLHLLPPELPVQPVRHAGTLRPAQWQRPQRRRLAGCPRPGHRPVCKRDILRFFRADAAYAIPAIYARLEEAGYFYAIRLPANNVLREKIAHRLTRPVGRPSLTKVKRFFEDFEYQAASWDKERRVIAKIEWHPGELFPRVGFIVTNLPMEPDWVVRFYNQRGTAEQHIKEGKYAFHWTRLSCRRFRDNEVRLQLHALAYNLATFLRCIELPEAMADWSLTSLQLKLIKIGARVVRHARAITFQLAEVAVTGPMVRAILAAIRRLRAPPSCA
jgi:hypothetical protein